MSSRTERVAMGSVVVEALDADQTARELRALVVLLKDAVDSGASVGYLPPCAEAESDTYWRCAAVAGEAAARGAARGSGEGDTAHQGAAAGDRPGAHAVARDARACARP